MLAHRWQLPNNLFVNSLPLPVKVVKVLNGAALRTAARKTLADAAALCCLVAMDTSVSPARWPRTRSGAGLQPASAAGTSHLRAT